MNIKKAFISLIIILSSIPISTYAYSDKLYVGGQNIGIKVNTKGILVMGLYKVDNEYIASSSGIRSGDYITKVNNKSINSISDFSNEIKNDEDKKEIDIEYIRDNKKNNTSLTLKNIDNEYKTGLYVKDSIQGIGTLTFIDPSTKKFGALGHEIQDKVSNEELDIKDGSIYYSNVTGINKSTNGDPGEKEAETDGNREYGNIDKNSNKGVFGTYTDKIENFDLLETADFNEIKLGKAEILTVTGGENVERYEINIEKLDKYDETKNILFTITDENLLNKTGGIVQGMSGSPIIQNNKIIGAVTHVIVDDCKSGYGIFIKNMLKETEN